MSNQLQTPLDDLLGVPNAALSGSLSNLAVVDDEGESTLLIETGDSFTVNLSWTVAGTLVPFFSGTWFAELFIDDIDGVGTKAGSLGVIAVPYPLNLTSPQVFNAAFAVPTAPGDQGLYKLVATVNLSLTGNPAQVSEMFGFVESTPIRIQDVDPVGDPL